MQNHISKTNIHATSLIRKISEAHPHGKGRKCHVPLRPDTHHFSQPWILPGSPIKLSALSQNSLCLSCPQTLELGITPACNSFPALVHSGNLRYPSGSIQMWTLLWNHLHFFPKHAAPLFCITLLKYFSHQIDYTCFKRIPFSLFSEHIKG